MIPWERLTSETFESLCHDILSDLGFKNIEWIGRTGGDRARDIIAYKTESITETKEVRRKFLVQCKRYLARPPSVTELNALMAWAEAHEARVVMVMVPNILTPDTYDWLEEIRPQKRYEIVIFDEKDFERFFDKHKETYAKHFGMEHVEPKLAVISSLLDDMPKDTKTIARSTGLSANEIANVLQELHQQGLVASQQSENGVLFRMEHTLSAFTGVAKLFLGGQQKFDFLLNQYSSSMNNAKLLEYVASRYHLVFEDEQRVALTKLFAISPSALRVALFSPTELYDTGHAHMQALKLDVESQKKLAHNFLTSFVATMLEEAIKDLHDNQSKKALEANEVEGYHVAVNIAMANRTKSILDLQSQTDIVMLPLKPGTAVKAGELLDATSPDLFILTGDILMNLRMFEAAILDYDRAIAGISDKKQLGVAWNNKGVCLLRLNRYDEAAKCFRQALENDHSLDIARKNLDKCHERDR